jgi:DnaK suppressor protein
MAIDFDRLIRTRLAEADDGVDAGLAELDAVRTARGESSVDDEHDPEGSTLSSEWSRIEGIVRAAEAQRIAVQLALARLFAGSYGTCLECSGPIAADRLLARPEAELCIDCAR